MIPLARIGALCCLASILTLASACHRQRRNAKYAEVEPVPAAAPADPAPAAAPLEGGSGAAPVSVDGSGGPTGGAATMTDAPPPPAALPPAAPPPDKPRHGPSAADVGAAVAVGVGAVLHSVPTQKVGGSVSSSTQSLCYDHNCNGSRTGKRCFGDRAAYCKSLCGESNCVARMACKSECR